MESKSYIKSFAEHEKAAVWARTKTKAHAKGDREIFVVVEGPEDDWVVCDLKTAIETELPYSWEA